jgi:hypothetical protein
MEGSSMAKDKVHVSAAQVFSKKTARKKKKTAKKAQRKK